MLVRVLGSLVIEGGDVALLGSRKARTLLTALAVAGGDPVPVDELVELLWGEQVPARPTDQLSVLASRLRRALGADRVVRTSGGYAVRADWIDVVELAERADEAAARFTAGYAGAARAAALSAMALARGPLAADEDSPWFDQRRRTAARIVARARSVLAQAAMATGDAMAAAAAAGDALDEDAYDEAALRILMRAHVALGRPASALAAYAVVRTRLRDDLGVSPAAETESVHDAIVVGTATTPTNAIEGALLVGRDAALAQLGALLDDVAGGVSVGVQIEGEAGIGKSTLTAAFLAGARDRALVVFGRCDEMGRELSLQPIVDGLDAHVRTLPDAAVSALLSGDAAVVAALLGRSSDDPGSRVTLGDGDAARELLYRGVLTVIERLAAGRAAIVVVEDVHLATPTTLTWLQLARRRGQRLLVLTTRRPEGAAALPGAIRIELGPLDAAAVAPWVGPARADALIARSGGNPLFLAELAAHDGDELPRSIRDLVATRVDTLGPAATTLRAAAVLGAAIDLDLLAAVQHRPVAELLDDLEQAVTARLLVEEATGLRFRHELVREALEAGTSAVRRAFLHREAAVALTGRRTPDPMAVAWHAQRAGDSALTADALVRAAAIASARFDVDETTRLLDDAIALRDDAATRLARARHRMTVWDLDAARVDVERAIALGAGAPAFELAGWVAYYRRDHADTLRLAEEGMVRSDEPAVRASCLSLAGRTRHTLGDLEAAEVQLREAVAIAPPRQRAVAQIWLGALRAHRGGDGEALDLTSRAMLGLEHATHPFAPAHALFARALSFGHRGQVLASLAALDELDALVAREGSQMRRFGSVATNCRGWVLRNVGELDAARAYNELAAGLPADEPQLAEPRYAGHLDLIEHELVLGDRAAARRRLDDIADIERWMGSMHWRHRIRYRLQRARVAIGDGDLDSASDIAVGVQEECRAQSVRRYELVAMFLAARAGVQHDRAVLVAALDELDVLAGLEVWWLTAELAAHFDDPALWQLTRRRVDTLAGAAGPYAASLRDHAADRFPSLVG